MVAPRVAFVSVPSSESNARQNRDAGKTKGREKERSEPIEKGRERDHMNTISMGVSRASVVAMSPENWTASANGSSCGIGAVITDMSVHAMRTTTDQNMTRSDVIEAEKKIHVKSGKQYLASTVSINAIKIISSNFLHLMFAGLLRPLNGIWFFMNNSIIVFVRPRYHFVARNPYFQQIPG